MSKRRKKQRNRAHHKPDQKPDLTNDIRLAPIADITHILHKSAQPPPSLAEEFRNAGPSWVSVNGLVRQVGSIESLAALSPSPHHDRSFDWAGVPEADRDAVGEILRNVEASTSLLFLDPEYQTSFWRVLHSLATDPTRPLDRRTSPTRKAAAVVWVALKANGQLGRGSRTTASDIWDSFGVGSCSALGKGFARSILVRNLGEPEASDCLESWWDGGMIPLGSAQLLHSRVRKSLIRQRDRLSQSVAARHANPGPVARTEDGIEMRTRPTTVRWAQRGASDEGRSMITIALGELDALELLAVSIPDARRLQAALGLALNGGTVSP